MSEPNKSFSGYVFLKDWISVPGEGRGVRAVGGRIEIKEQTELVGFKVKGNESNWVAVVRGKKETVYLLGCQIKGFAQCEVKPDSDVWTVS